MPAPLILGFFWAIAGLLEIALLVYLVRRRVYRQYPAFLAYVIAALVESAGLAACYLYLGPSSMSSYYIGWSLQGVVICARWFSVVEIAKRALADYAGIWTLAGYLLLVLSASVLLYAIASSGSRWDHLVLNADRAVELCVATFIVGLFLFVRYYQVPMANFPRILAIGFCLYSCFVVINDSIFENWNLAVGPLWNYLDMLTFLASLLLWTGAAHKYSETTTVTGPSTLSSEQYQELSQRLDSRLHLLNDRLNRLFHSEDSHP
jgi:hypothetical protein